MELVASQLTGTTRRDVEAVRAPSGAIRSTSERRNADASDHDALRLDAHGSMVLPFCTAQHEPMRRIRHPPTRRSAAVWRSIEASWFTRKPGRLGPDLLLIKYYRQLLVRESRNLPGRQRSQRMVLGMQLTVRSESAGRITALLTGSWPPAAACRRRCGPFAGPCSPRSPTAPPGASRPSACGPGRRARRGSSRLEVSRGCRQLQHRSRRQ